MNHRLLLNPLPASGSETGLSAQETRHARVLRLREGEQIELFDGEGNAMSAEVIVATPEVRVRLLGPAPTREPAREVVLCLALIQPERFELAIQKATELGVAAIQPLVTEHGEVRPERIHGKLDRWRKIATEAAKQCGRSRIPAVHEPVAAKELLRREPQGTIIMFDATGDPIPHIEGPVAAWVGPEGGWSDAELQELREAGAAVVSLGTRRLRAETAAMLASALLTEPWKAE